MAYNDKIAYEETLADCLVSLFGSKAENGVNGSGSGSSESTDTGTDVSGSETSDLSITEIAQLVQDYYDKAKSAQQSGDWAEYGENLDKMEEYLNMLVE